MNATVNIVCYKSKTLSNGEHPLMVRICKDNKIKYKSLGLSVHPDNWDFKKDRPKIDCPNRELLLKIILEKEIEYQNEILELVSLRKDYTATTLMMSKNNQVKIKTVEEFYKEIIEYYRKIDKPGTSDTYKYSMNSIIKYYGTGDMPFSYIDVSWLKGYEKWLRDNNCTEVTLSFYFRTLRTAYNKAISAKYAHKENYPFNEYKVSKFNIKTKKRSIKKDAIKKIMKIDLKEYFARFSRDIFIFSYLCGGINFIDISRLRKENIVNDTLYYIRKKTKKEISIPLSKEAIKIIEKYSSNSIYIFPVLDDRVHKTEIQKYYRVKKVLRKINNELKKIAKIIGLSDNINLTTYVARHSFATILKKSGINIALISESLGHSDITTTEIYLDSFENEQIEEAFKNLL